MDALTQDDIQWMIGDHAGPCVSVFLPTHRAGAEIQQDPIRLRNLLREAEQRLAAFAPGSEASGILEPARELLDDTSFWQHQSDGLALFLTREDDRRFRVPLALPELTIVAARFQLGPLLPLLSGQERFHVLALSQNQVRLIEATRYGAAEVDLTGVPRSMEQVLGKLSRERQLQLRTSGSGAQGGRTPAVFHGHGGPQEEPRENLLRYARAVDQGIRGLLKDDAAPLVLASVEEFFSIYREASTHPALLVGVPGNPDELKASDLGRRGWELVQPELDRTRARALARYAELAGTGRASSQPAEVLSAAHSGRVDVLFVPVGVQHWGVFRPEDGSVELREPEQPGGEDLLNLAAVHTVLNRGTVYAVDAGSMPDGALLAAVYRY